MIFFMRFPEYWRDCSVGFNPRNLIIISTPVSNHSIIRFSIKFSHTKKEVRKERLKENKEKKKLLLLLYNVLFIFRTIPVTNNIL